METIELSAPGGVRLDKLIADGTELSRSAAVKLIEQGNVLVNGSLAGKKDIPAAGSAVEITLPELSLSLRFPSQRSRRFCRKIFPLTFSMRILM